MSRSSAASEAPLTIDRITDWYLPDSGALDGFVVPDNIPIRNLPAIHDAAQRLLLLCKEAVKGLGADEEFKVVDTELGHADLTPGTDGNEERKRVFRGHRIYGRSDLQFQLRRMPDFIPPLSKLGMPPGVVDVLLHEALQKGGLIVLAGEAGNGKSTTCAAVIRDRLLKFGVFCLTVEDPIEMPLDGEYEREGGAFGQCIQTEVSKGNFADAVRGSLRAFPTSGGNIFYVGEIRDAETATELLKAANNGHLVISTIHANNVQSAFRRLMMYASYGGQLGEESVKSSLADAIRVMLHQTLERVPAVGKIPSHKQLRVEFLLSHGADSGAAATIRRSKIESISSIIEQQRRTMEMQGVRGLLNIW